MPSSEVLLGIASMTIDNPLIVSAGDCSGQLLFWVKVKLAFMWMAVILWLPKCTLFLYQVSNVWGMVYITLLLSVHFAGCVLLVSHIINSHIRV